MYYRNIYEIMLSLFISGGISLIKNLMYNVSKYIKFNYLNYSYQVFV